MVETVAQTAQQHFEDVLDIGWIDQVPDHQEGLVPSSATDDGKIETPKTKSISETLFHKSLKGVGHILRSEAG